MKITTIENKLLFGTLIQNTYIIEIDNKYFIIDAGANIDDILNIVKDKKVSAILITHCHYDHIKNIENYDKTFNSPIYLHKNSKNFLIDKELNLSPIFQDERIFNIKNAKFIDNDTDLKIDNINIKCYYTPGHTNDSISYLFPNKILFTGDTLFSDSIGRTDFKSGSQKDMLESLLKIKNIDFSVMYPGHMEPSNKIKQNKNIDYFINLLKTE